MYQKPISEKIKHPIYLSFSVLFLVQHCSSHQKEDQNLDFILLKT